MLVFSFKISSHSSDDSLSIPGSHSSVLNWLESCMFSMCVCGDLVMGNGQWYKHIVCWQHDGILNDDKTEKNGVYMWYIIVTIFGILGFACFCIVRSHTSTSAEGIRSLCVRSCWLEQEPSPISIFMALANTYVEIQRVSCIRGKVSEFANECVLERRELAS
jgi:hypothetical protein